MGTDEKLGQLKEGYLADMLLVDGDPLDRSGGVGRCEASGCNHERRCDSQERPQPSRNERRETPPFYAYR